MAKIKIISKKKVFLPDVPDIEKGAVLKRFYYEIKLSNGSEWICDSNGENWKMAKFEKENLSDKELLSGLFKK